MKITEIKEVVTKEIEETLVGRKCDVCGKEISLSEKTNNHGYNYFVIQTWHNDWGRDSCDSNKFIDACCEECVMKFVKDYIHNAYEHPFNSKGIDIRHVRTLDEGAPDNHE